MLDYSKEVKELIKENIKHGFYYGKSIDYLSFRLGITKQEMEEELLNCLNLEFTVKQFRGGEVRYVLYFVYSRNSGRAYVITFREGIRIITAYPLGKKTLKKYHKKGLKT